MVWSKKRTINGKPVNFGYTLGLVKVAHRLLAVVPDEEEAFWIVNAIIRANPRFFSMEASSLEGDRLSLMRNELTAFKAVLKKNLPDVCSKLQNLGLSVENLVYDGITSFYSYYFSSEVLYRIWDVMIFAMGTGFKNERKRAIWYLLTPAFYIMQARKIEIANALTAEEVIKAFRNGFAFTYSGDEAVN